MSNLSNYTNKQYYPYVVLPPEFEELLQLPSFPTLKLPVRPQPPDEPLLNRSLAIGLLYFLLSLTVVLILSGMPWFVWAVLALFTLNAWGMVTSINTYPQRLASYEERLAGYTQAMAQYEDQLSVWEKHCKEMEIENQRKREQIQEDWRNQPLTGLKSREPDCSRRAKVGRFDSELRRALQLQLKQCSTQEIAMELLPNWCSLAISNTDCCYTPDIALSVSFDSTTLLIDVEVDEPWFYKDDVPTPNHCLDDRNHHKRDLYFQKNGWVVIRFAEQQVSGNATLCAQFVVAVARHLLRSRCHPLPEIEFQQRWDSTNALQHNRPSR